MKTYSKLFIAAMVAVLFTGTMSFASTGLNKVLIRENSNHIVNLRTSLEADETMLVVITDQDGEIVLSDKVSDTPGLVIKRYDFNRARFGDYKIEVFINQELTPTTVISKEGVTLQSLYSMENY